MENLKHENIAGTHLHMNGTCDNCGREIEDLEKECPHCHFMYKVEIEEDGIFYV